MIEEPPKKENTEKEPLSAEEKTEWLDGMEEYGEQLEQEIERLKEELENIEDEDERQKTEDLIYELEQQKCFHWSNTQPMTKSKNSKKGNNTTLKEQHLHEIKAKAFALANGYDFLKFDRTEYL